MTNLKLLAVDSSGLVASVALFSDGIMLAEYTVNYKKTHSQTLLPMIDEVLRMTDFDPKDLDAIAVAEGPGSFTGLRIGAATVKGLGLALQKPIIGVPTLDALAYNLFSCELVICPLMNAKRNQVYTGLYCFCGQEFEVLQQQDVIALEKIVEQVNLTSRPVIYLGDGVEVYQEQLIHLTKVPFYFAPAHISKQRAGAVAALGEKLFKEGHFQAAEDFRPVYLRLSQAEREREERSQIEEVENGIASS